MKNKKNWLLLLGLILFSANLRTPITAVGSLVSYIGADLNLSSAVSGFITTIPLVAFAVVSFFVGRMSKRLGMERTMFYGMLLILGGEILRSYTGAVGLFAGTAIMGCGIAVGNVLIPGMIKWKFPTKIGLLTAIYTTAMAVFSGIGSGFSVPLAEALGSWRHSLCFWAIFAILAIVIWLPQITKKNSQSAGPAGHPSGKDKSVYKSPLSWSIALMLGLQSFLFYAYVAWLPTIAQSRGMSAEAGGYIGLIFQYISLPSSFIIPILAGRAKNQKGLVIVSYACHVVGLLGFLFGQGDIMLYASTVFSGLAAGATMALAMTIIGLRAANPRQAAELSGMSQSIGYGIAAFSPMLIGAIYDATASWTIPLILLLVAGLAAGFFGLKSGENRHLFSEDDQIKEAS
ncbi:CynX/NimT family MFS transporter [Gehongia tenuis]|uniref:MFS transporter n=1 Tax=Gehongia tenuis TaxID=2763655 RepID=A0A926HPR7_9FIRM|nr:MFS transporter [Gehongia tenuis]